MVEYSVLIVLLFLAEFVGIGVAGDVNDIFKFWEFLEFWQLV